MFKQQHLYGLSRKELVISKGLLISLLPLIIVICLVFLSAIFGVKYSEKIGMASIFQKSYFIFTFYLQSITYMSFAMMIVCLIGHTGLSIVVYFGYLFFEAIIRFIFRIKEITEIIYFFPAKSIASLTPRPSLETAISESLQGQIQLTDRTTQFPMIVTILIACIYLLFFWWLSFSIMKRRDL